MSDNSIIYLLKTGKGYSIVHADIDTGAKYTTRKTKTAEQALKLAQEMQDEFSPEYGIQIDLGDK